MSFRLVPKSLTLNGVMAVILPYFSEFVSFQRPYQQSAVLVFVSVVRAASIATSWPPQLVTPRCF